MGHPVAVVVGVPPVGEAGNFQEGREDQRRGMWPGCLQVLLLQCAPGALFGFWADHNDIICSTLTSYKGSRICKDCKIPRHSNCGGYSLLLQLSRLFLLPFSFLPLSLTPCPLRRHGFHLYEPLHKHTRQGSLAEECQRLTSNTDKALGTVPELRIVGSTRRPTFL